MNSWQAFKNGNFHIKVLGFWPEGSSGVCKPTGAVDSGELHLEGPVPSWSCSPTSLAPLPPTSSFTSFCCLSGSWRHLRLQPLTSPSGCWHMCVPCPLAHISMCGTWLVVVMKSDMWQHVRGPNTFTCNVSFNRQTLSGNVICLCILGRCTDKETYALGGSAPCPRSAREGQSQDVEPALHLTLFPQLLVFSASVSPFLALFSPSCRGVLT